jgi:hypothetical protein
MISNPEQSSSIAKICESVKRLGYGANQNIRLYGEEFEVISDPFPEAGGIAVSVRTKHSQEIRALQLPATVLQRSVHVLTLGRKHSPTSPVLQLLATFGMSREILVCQTVPNSEFRHSPIRPPETRPGNWLVLLLLLFGSSARTDSPTFPCTRP